MKRNFSKLKNNPVDLLILGGGIYGAWIAYCAARAGLSTAIIEQGDWGQGTSSASSKLIHGGLRYLEFGHVNLVRSALAERDFFLRNAPHRVTPVFFNIPLYPESRWKSWQLQLGLNAYSLLAPANKDIPPFKKMKKEELLQVFPALETKTLIGGFRYSDLQMDDARLTLEIIAGAMEAGAVACNYTSGLHLLQSGNHVTGALIQNKETGETLEVHAAYTVAATGPWQIPWNHPPRKNLNLCHVKGSHLVIPAIPKSQALLLSAPDDNRVVFYIPWYGRALLGTTESDFSGDPGTVAVTDQETAYLLHVYNHTFPSAPLHSDSVLGKFAGVRTLKKSSLPGFNALSREWILSNPMRGLYVPVGGKFTTARRDALKTIKTLYPHTTPLLTEEKTNKRLPWCPKIDFTTWREGALAEMKNLSIMPPIADALIQRYGVKMPALLQVLSKKPVYRELLTEGLPFLKGEIIYTFREEMAVNLTDIFRRRIPIDILASTREKRNMIPQVTEILRDLDWDSKRIEQECQTLEV